MRNVLIIVGCLAVGCALILALAMPRSVQALPEYSAQTGEPCATCHISPSGGGPRGPRGQAWVGSGKPGAVPDLLQALEILGVRLEKDPGYFTIIVQPPAPPAPLSVPSADQQDLFNWLNRYDGN